MTLYNWCIFYHTEFYFAKIIKGQTICNVLSPFYHFLKDLFAADISGMI